MKAILNVLVVTEGNGGAQEMWKTIDLPFAPSLEMEVECSPWDSPRKVKGVRLCLDPDDDQPYLFIWMGREEVDTDEQKESRIERYESHGWKEPGVGD